MCSRVAGLMKPLMKTEATTRPAGPDPAPSPALASQYGSMTSAAAGAGRDAAARHTQGQAEGSLFSGLQGLLSSCWRSVKGWVLPGSTPAYHHVYGANLSQGIAAVPFTARPGESFTEIGEDVSSMDLTGDGWNWGPNKHGDNLTTSPEGEGGGDLGGGGGGGRGGRGSHDFMEGEPLTVPTRPRPGHDPERDTSQQEDRLLEAASSGNVKRLQSLLDHGVDVNVARRGGDYPGWRALHRAAEGGHAGAVRVLLEAEADTGATIGEGGPLAAQLAAQGGHLDVVKELVPRMTLDDRLAFTPEWPDSGEAQHPPAGQQLLHLAALGGHVDVLEYLLKQGFDVNAVTTDGRQQTALHVACECLNEAAACQLLQVEDCDVAAQDARGYRAVDIAAEHGSNNLAEILRAAEKKAGRGEDHTTSPEEAGHTTRASGKRNGKRNKKSRRRNGHRAQKNLPRGLRNLGNTCYMNAVLQCLYHTDKLTTFFLDDDWRTYKTKIKIDDQHIGGSGEDCGRKSRDGEHNAGNGKDRGTSNIKDGGDKSGRKKAHGRKNRDGEDNGGREKDLGSNNKDGGDKSGNREEHGRKSKDGEHNGRNRKDHSSRRRDGDKNIGSKENHGSKSRDDKGNSGSREDHGSKSRDEHNGGSGEDRRSKMEVEYQGTRRGPEDQGSSSEIKDQGSSSEIKDQGSDSDFEDLSGSIDPDEHGIGKGLEDDCGSKDTQENGGSRDGETHDGGKGVPGNGGSTDGGTHDGSPDVQEKDGSRDGTETHDGSPDVHEKGGSRDGTETHDGSPDVQEKGGSRDGAETHDGTPDVQEKGGSRDGETHDGSPDVHEKGGSRDGTETHDGSPDVQEKGGSRDGTETHDGSPDVLEKGGSRDGTETHDGGKGVPGNGGRQDESNQGSRRDVDLLSSSDGTLEEPSRTSFSQEYHGEVAESYCALVRALRNRDDPETPLVNFKATVDRYDPSFVGYRQHEAHDLLSFLLDALDRDLQGRGQSLPAEVFFGLHVSTITCRKTRQEISQVEELFTCLSLPVVKTWSSKGQTLQKCFENYYMQRTLLWDCPSCCTTHECVSATVIKKLPKVLVIHLGRVVDSPHDTHKERVKFPLKLTEMHQFARGERRREYELFAACYHFGSTLSGHYTASCRSLDGGEAWHYFDDDCVTQRSGPTAEGAHILFYRS